MLEERAEPAVLAYHSLDSTGDALSTDPDWFRETLVQLLDWGFRCIDLEKWIAAGRPSAPRTFAITFDDCDVSLLRASEILSRLELSATAFVVTQWVGRDNDWPGQPRWVPRRKLASWSQIRDMENASLCFGSHTRSHPRLDMLNHSELASEIAGSWSDLAENVARPSRLIAYPYGFSSEAARSSAARVYLGGFGTRLAYTSVHDSLYDLSRIDAWYLRRPADLKRLFGLHGKAWLALRRIPREARRIAGEAAPSWVVAKSARRSLFHGGFRIEASRIKPALKGNKLQAICYVCPECKTQLGVQPHGWLCGRCVHSFPNIGEVADLRLSSDRYLSLEEDRAKALKLARLPDSSNYLDLARAYYEMSDDVRGRGPRFLAHIASAEERGSKLAEFLPEGRVLELGCGSGGLAAAARKKGIEIEALDVASRWLMVASRRLRDLGLEARLTAADAARLPFPDASFDAAVADSLLEHLDHPLDAIREWHRVLAPGGELILWSPNRYFPWIDPHVGLWGVGLLPRRLALRYVSILRPFMHSILSLSAFEAAALARQAGFIDVRVEPVAVQADWQSAASAAWRVLASIYERSCAVAPGRRLALMCGPIWQLRASRGIECAVKREAA